MMVLELTMRVKIAFRIAFIIDDVRIRDETYYSLRLLYVAGHQSAACIARKIRGKNQFLLPKYYTH